MPKLPYNNYSNYLKRTYGRNLYRVCVDAGFSCPNRVGGSGTGCSYCTEDGSRAPYLQLSSRPRATAGDGPSDTHGINGGNQLGTDLKAQVEEAIRFLKRRYDAQDFILYFQANSGTNAPVEELKKIYDAALFLAPFRELIVSTRPDCIDEQKAELLVSYRRSDFDVWVELGLQSAKNETLRRISRGHTAADFLASYDLLKRRCLKVAVHLIFGLPGETIKDIGETARFVAGLCPDAVKIHNLHIPSGTPLAREFLKGEVSAPGTARHLEYVIAALEVLPPETLIMRLTCDTPRVHLLSPRGFKDKQAFIAELVKEMRSRGTWQGRLYSRVSRSFL